MYGYTFYLEHASPSDKRKGKNTGNVVAVEKPLFYNRSKGDYVYNALCSITANYPNSSCLSWGEVSPEYLRENCTRIGEQEAREHHPNLFVRLENDIKKYS